MTYFIFNNVNSKDLGIIVKSPITISRAEKNIEALEVSGRNGNLYIDNNTYKSKTCEIQCVLTDLTKIDQIKVLYIGEGTLETSDELGREYIAMIKNQIDFEKYLTYLREFPLQFELYPIAYSKETKKITITENSTFSISGNCSVFPILTVIGTGSIVLNNQTVIIEESGITIDCDLMNCTKDGLNANDKVNLEEFPSLNPGENNIEFIGEIQSVLIQYKEGWL